MRLTDSIGIPEWLTRFGPVFASLGLLLCSLALVSFNLGVGLRPGDLWNVSAPRCFDNAEPLMPATAALHALMCPVDYQYFGGQTNVLRELLVRICLYGGVVGVWLAARALSGWWAAGVAAAFIAASSLLFAIDEQLTPAALGVLFAITSSWLVIEAFRPERSNVKLWRWLWAASALLAIGFHASMAWLVLAQGVYALVRLRHAQARAVPVTIVGICGGAALISAFITQGVLPNVAAKVEPQYSYLRFAFEHPIAWLQAHDYVTFFILFALLVLFFGASVARSTALPYFVMVVFMEAFTASTFAPHIMQKDADLALGLAIVAMALGACTAFLIQRKPYAAVFALAIFAVAAHYAGVARIQLRHYDVDQSAIAAPAFRSFESVRLYHDYGHAERVTVYPSKPAMLYGLTSPSKPATTRAQVIAIAPYRSDRWQVYYAYRVRAADNSWSGYVGETAMWPEPPRGGCVRQPYSKIRLYERPDVAFRDQGHAWIEAPGIEFQVLGINERAWQPELHTHVIDKAGGGSEGWVYAQAILVEARSRNVNSAAGFRCKD
ncbi:MAG TPA: hypothetical protein VN860_03675 [Candidatus Acidoferrales bacterium]|nr:hypothetical protein [Candidatus Acidoferrales bacterium]